MSVAYIALGSNLGDKEENLRRAIDLLAQAGVEIVASSSFYATKPYGVTDQPDFLNGVVEVNWTGSAVSLLHVLLATEKTMGRQRLRHWGERNIDLDLLFFGKEIINTQELVLPHPDLQNRLFVLEPLCELAADFVHPVLGKTMSLLLTEFRKTQEK